ncbi:hypothetical protein T07_10396 [Trichinella nelsoni]|uniref:Uncharacterized protein n=1 Tax=Trichinella nelsoni TaxID=6336 RepID=A0A0V0SAV4_9BILA|nr:hypothetical protein T07_10396 [Trichinella nelsoni]
MDDEDHFADDEMEIEVQTPVIKKKKIRVRKSKKKSVENQFLGQSVHLRDNSKTDNVSNMESNQNLSDCEYSQNIQTYRRHSSMKQNNFASEMKSSYRDDALLYLSYQRNDGMGTLHLRVEVCLNELLFFKIFLSLHATLMMCSQSSRLNEPLMKQ